MVRTLASAALAALALAPGAALAQDFTREFQAMPHQFQAQPRHERSDDWLYQQMVPVVPGSPAAPGTAPRAQWNRLGNLAPPTGTAQPAVPGQGQFRASTQAYGTDARRTNPHYGATRSLNPPQAGAPNTAQRRPGAPPPAPPGTVREVRVPR